LHAPLHTLNRCAQLEELPSVETDYDTRGRSTSTCLVHPIAAAIATEHPALTQETHLAPLSSGFTLRPLRTNQGSGSNSIAGLKRNIAGRKALRCFLRHSVRHRVHP